MSPLLSFLKKNLHNQLKTVYNVTTFDVLQLCCTASLASLSSIRLLSGCLCVC